MMEFNFSRGGDADRSPVEMVSRDVLERYRKIEAAARVAAHNRGGVTGEARRALDALTVVLVTP